MRSWQSPSGRYKSYPERAAPDADNTRAVAGGTRVDFDNGLWLRRLLQDLS